MPDPRIVVVDDNQRFCEQVVAAFAEVSLSAQGFSRGSEALPVISCQHPELLVVDLLRPGSEGRWLLEQVFSPHAIHGPLAVLALVGVTDDLSILPDGVDALVRPVFPRQVVASAQRLLPGQSVRSGRLQATLRGLPAIVESQAVHSVPAARSGPVPIAVQDKITARQEADLSAFDVEDSDFEPGETLLAPESIAALAKEMMRPQTDDVALLSSSDLLAIDEDLVAGEEDTQPRDGLRLSRSPSVKVQAAATQGEEVLSGDLSVMPLLEVIDLLAQKRHSGILTVTASGRQVVVYFLDGLIAQATAQGLPSLRLGRFLLELDGPLRQPEIDAVAAQLQARSGPLAASGESSPDSLLGLRLLRAGLLRREDLWQALSRQTCELICEALRMPSGRFVFARTRQLPPSVLSDELGGALQLDPTHVLLEGQRRMDDWNRFEQDVSEGAIYVSHGSATSELLRFGLSQSELTVLGLCNGRASVADIARESRLPLTEVSRTLSRLLALRLLRRRLPALLAL